MQLYNKMYPFLFRYGFNLSKMLLFLLCFFTLPMLSAQDPKVTVTVNNTPLNYVFTQIESQTKYSFAFVNSSFDTTRKITISVQNTDLGIVLDKLLKGTGYSYTIRKGRIFLSPVKIEKKEEKLITAKNIEEKPIVSVKTGTKTKNIDVKPLLISEKKNIDAEPLSALKDSLDINKTVEILNRLADRKLLTYSKTPLWAVKSNLLLDLTGSISLGVEVKTGERYSFDLSVSYNPWEFNVNRNWKHILVQPEIRYWLCEPFNGHFFGLHGLYAHYNLSGLPFSDYMKNSRLQGDLYGAGLSYGYQWSLSKRWSIEGSFGVGYVHAGYDRYACKTCRDYIGRESKNYFAPTKTSLSLIYFIK